MPIQIIGDAGAIADVDGESFRAQRIVSRGPEYASFGSYQASITSAAVVSGALATGSATAGHVFAFRWGDSKRLCLLTYVKFNFQTVALFTANQLVDFGFDAYVARNYVATHTGNLAAVLTNNSFKRRKAMGTTLLADMRIASGAALAHAAGGSVQDDNAFAKSIGDPQHMRPTAGTEAQRVNDPTFAWCGRHPLVFVQNEGFVIRNRKVWPAAGSGLFSVTVRWSEVEGY
mgnify:CR=1 FL=1